MLPIVDLKWLNSWSRINIEPKTRDFRSSTTYTTYLSKKKKKKIGQDIHLFLYMVNCKLHWMQHDIVHFLIYMDELALCVCFSNQLNAFFVTVTSFALFTLLGGNLTPPQAFTSWTPSLEQKKKKKVLKCMFQTVCSHICIHKQYIVQKT